MAAAKAYVKESFPVWAHPLDREIDITEIYKDYHFFIPMTVFRRGAAGFRDLTQTRSMEASATAYCTALQFLGELLRFLPQKGTAPKDCKNTITITHRVTVDGKIVTKTETMPKIRFIVQLIVRDTRANLAVVGQDMLPDHELTNPNNQLGVLVTMLVHDPELELVDLIEMLVSENAANKPPERRAYLLEELKNYKRPTDGQENEEEDGNVVGAGQGGGSGPSGLQPSSGYGKNKKRKKYAANSFQAKPPSTKKDPIDDYLKFQDVDELWRAVSLLLDIATETLNVSSCQQYTTRTELDEAIRGDRDSTGKCDSIVSLPERLCLSETLERIRAFARRTPGPEPSSDQLFLENYFYDATVPWEPWMDDDEEEVESGGGTDSTGPAPDTPTPLPPLPCVVAADEYDEAESVTPPSFGEDATIFTDHDYDGPVAVTTVSAVHQARPTMVERKYFRIPVPKLAWELSPQQASARRLMSVTFPWKRADAGMVFLNIMTRILQISLDEAMRLSRMCSTGKQYTNAGEGNGMGNAAHVAAVLGLRQFGPQHQEVPIGEATQVESEWSPESALGVNRLESEIPQVGKKLLAARTGVLAYVNPIVTRHEVRIAELEGRRKRKSRRAQNHVQKRTRLESRSTLEEDEEDAEEEAILESDTELTEEETAEIADCRNKIKDLKSRAFMAFAELGEAALGELLTLFETSACIPDSIKAGAMWINRHEDMTLGYDMTFRDMGPFGQMVTSMMIGFKKYGVATNQWPLFLLMIARDSVYIAPRIRSLIMHVALRGVYAGGKSAVLEFLKLLSIICTVCSITGASSQGMLPIYEDKPSGDTMMLWEELPTLVTSSNRHMSSADLRVARILASWMTSNEIGYDLNVKGADNKIHAEHRRIIAPTSQCGAMNDGASGNQAEARMIPVYLRPNVPGPRNAVNAMCNANTASGRDAAERAGVELVMQKHQALSMLTCKAVEAGSMSPPNGDEFYLMLEKANEYLQTYYPDQASKVRMIDVGSSMAAVLATWTAVVLAYAPGLAQVDAVGDPIDQPSLAIPFDITKTREHIIRYLRIDQDVAMFVIAYIVYYSSQPEANLIMRWFTETHSGYPFISVHKQLMKEHDQYGAADELSPSVAQEPPQPITAQRGRVSEPRLRDIDTVRAELKGLRHYDFVCLPLNAGRARGRGVKNPPPRLRRGIGEADLSLEERMLLEFDEMEGPTVNLPLDGRAGRKRELTAKGVAYFSGSEEPSYDYKMEKVPVDCVSKHVLFYNPNYIFVPGNIETFASTYVTANRGAKMTAEQVHGLLEGLTGNSMLANLLPFVPPERKKLLLEIEVFRAQLWRSDVCRRRQSRIMIKCQRGVHVLIEALLDSPKHIVTKVLRHLCNETTIKRKVILPIPHRHCPEVLKTFDAYPVSRRLKCGNPAYMGLEIAALPREVREQVAVSDTGTDKILLEWGAGSEIESIRRYFREHGVLGNAADFTYETLYKTRIAARQEQDACAGRPNYLSYPKDFIRLMRTFDAVTKRENVVDPLE